MTIPVTMTIPATMTIPLTTHHDSTLHKVGPHFWHAWANALRRAPNALLWLLEFPRRAAANLAAQAAAQGVHLSRLRTARTAELALTLALTLALALALTLNLALALTLTLALALALALALTLALALALAPALALALIRHARRSGASTWRAVRSPTSRSTRHRTMGTPPRGTPRGWARPCSRCPRTACTRASGRRTSPTRDARS